MTKRPSIAIWYNLPSGGAKRALWQQVTALCARGYRVKVWSPSTADHTFLDVGQVTDERVLPLARAWISRWDKVGSPTAPWRRSLSVMAEVCRLAVAEMKAEGFDLLLAHSCQELVVPPIIRHWNGPAVLYLQEPNRGLYEAVPQLKWVALRPRAALPLSHSSLSRWRELARIGLAAVYEQAEAALFDRILVNSYFSREAIVRCYGLDATVCYLGIDCDLFRPLNCESEGFVVGVGAAEPHKGVELAVRTVASLPSRLRTRLRWIANKSAPAYVMEVNRLAGQLGVDFDLRVRIPDLHLVQLLNRARAFLHTASLEPFGYAPLEAMSCGAAVVALGEGGVREFVRDGSNGLLAPEGSPLSLARQLANVLESPDLAKQLGQAGRRTVVEEWTLEKAATRLEENLREVYARPTMRAAVGTDFSL